MSINLGGTEIAEPIVAVKSKLDLIEGSIKDLEASVSGIGDLLSRIVGEPISDVPVLEGSPNLSHLLHALPERIENAASRINTLVYAISQELF